MDTGMDGWMDGWMGKEQNTSLFFRTDLCIHSLCLLIIAMERAHWCSCNVMYV
jgi:hypothetical protein